MFRTTLLGGLAAISALLIGLVPMSAEAAQSHFDCRASALRLNLPLGQVLDPVVANPSNNPCTTDSQAVLSFKDVLGLGISTGTLFAKTSGDRLYARTKVEGANVAGLLGLLDLHAKAIRAKAQIIAKPNGKCQLHSGSTLVGLKVQGQAFASLRTPLDLDVKLLGIVVGKLHLNATLGGRNPTIGKPDPERITQRAVWLHITDPVLQGKLADLVVGEASADAIGKPCS